MNKNYEGTIDQIIRFIYDSPNILENDKDFINALKNRLNYDVIKNKTAYLMTLRDSQEHFNNLIQLSINNLLVEAKRTENNTDEYFTPLELAKILDITKGNVFNWINKGDLKVKQNIKGGKVKIHINDINTLMNNYNYQKYKNKWNNRF